VPGRVWHKTECECEEEYGTADGECERGRERDTGQSMREGATQDRVRVSMTECSAA
jgi:hypothetical protein